MSSPTTLNASSFVIGEHGFYPNTSSWDVFHDMQASNPVAGSMVWSLREHADTGGFVTHGEGGDIYSYHIPGWSPPTSPMFDALEQYIVGSTYTASHRLLNQAVPHYPAPWAPTILAANTTGNGTAFFQFVGGTWAEHYEVFHAVAGNDGGWQQAVNYLRDDVDAGMANFTVDSSVYGDGNGSWVMRGVSFAPLLKKGPWSNVLTIE